MFWLGIVIGLFAGACLGFMVSVFLFVKLEATKGKSIDAPSVHPRDGDLPRATKSF